MKNWVVPGRWLWRLAIANLIVIGMMMSVSAPLKTPVTPYGIVSFEFAATLANSQQMLAAWDTTARAAAGLNLGLDYLFLVLYGLFLHLACLKMAAVLPENSSAGNGRRMAWVPVVAAALDFVENGALASLLLGAQDETLPKIAHYCASIKFALLGGSLGYLLQGGITLLFNRLKHPGVN